MSQAVDSFEAPGDPLEGVDELEGKSVDYVPANGQVPLFPGIRVSLEQALGNAGIRLEVCDGEANPATWLPASSRASTRRQEPSSPADHRHAGHDDVGRAGQPRRYEKACPDCEVTVVKANTGQLDKLSSLVTSELSKNPDIGYVQMQFDYAVQPTVQGLQGANATGVVRRSGSSREPGRCQVEGAPEEVDRAGLSRKRARTR